MDTNPDDLPEVRAAVEAGHDVERANRRVVQIALVAAAAVVGLSIWSATEVGAIRDTQLHNTSVSQCQARAFDVIAGDVSHLLSGDKNRADYPIPKPCDP